MNDDRERMPFFADLAVVGAAPLPVRCSQPSSRGAAIERTRAVMEDNETEAGRRRRRRRFAAHLAPLAVLLLALGVVFADEDGVLGTVGLVALAQGIGLAVALIWLARGHNPLSRG